MDEAQPKHEDQNRAELTPNQPCAVCGAAHNPDEGIIVGRVDEESDLPYGLLEFETLQDDPHEKSFCNECIKNYLQDIQSEIKVLNPRQADAASLLLLGVELADADEAINNRPDDELARSAVHDYRTRARRHLVQALDLISVAGPILKGPGRGGQVANPHANQKKKLHWLETIPGVGEGTAEALQEAGFESKDDVREASQSDLTNVRGVGSVLAGDIKEAVGENGGEEEVAG